MSQLVAQAFYGSFFHTPVYGSFQYLHNALIEVNGAGYIYRVVEEDDPQQPELLRSYRESGILTELGEDRCGLPGFVDIHVHAPQWPQAGLALDEPLYLWLDQRTFPLESKFADLEFAERVYSDLVSQVANSGYVYRSIYENQCNTVEYTQSARDQVVGVSSDEELSNMIKLQNAYNASSRYINAVSEMLEHIIVSLA